jgi:uracil-DNA glycosylase
MSRGLNAIQELVEKYQNCQACPLLCGRTQAVFGGGSVSADILIVGESPGEAEDETGVPFWGDAGRLLMQLLADVWPQNERLAEVMALKPDDDLDDPNGPFFSALRDYLDDHIFWTNVLLCRTPEGRAAATQEVKNCRDRLQRTVYAVDPMLIIAAGKTAASVLVGKAVAVSSKSGTIFDITIPSPVTGSPVRYPVLAIHQPAFLLRQGDQTLYGRKQGDTWATAQALDFGLTLLRQQYADLYQTDFPDRPPGVKK